MICLISFLYWEATGKILQCEDCPRFDECFDECKDEAEEES